MTQDPDGWGARSLEAYDAVEKRLAEMITAPHWKVRRGKLVLGDDGKPVPDPRPARKAAELLAAFRRQRAIYAAYLKADARKEADGPDPAEVDPR